MDVDGIQTPSKRCRTASGSAPTRATIARMTRLQKTRPDALTAHYGKPPPGSPCEFSDAPARSAQPAGDEQRLAGDPGRVLRGQEDHRGSDVVGLADAPERS